MLTDKREILHIKSYFSKHANEEIVVEIIEYCIAIFNSAVGKNFLNMQNLKIGFFNLENGIAVYERFCKQYFPSYLGKYHDDYTQDGYMNSFVAQAFINHDTYGILCSLDTDVDPNSWYETILHEMVHIYCTTHESNGDNFFDKYCVNKKNNFKDGTMGAGYEVWREFIAYYWGAELTPFSTPLSLAQVRAEVRNIDEDVDAKNSVAKMLGLADGAAVLPAVLLQTAILSLMMALVGLLCALLLKDFRQFTLAYLVIAIFAATPVFLSANTSIKFDWIGYHPFYHVYMGLKNAYFGTAISPVYYASTVGAILLLFLVVRLAFHREIGKEG